MKTTQNLYEILIRFKDGKVQGAHQRFLQEVKDDVGIVVFSKELDPTPIKPADVSAILGEPLSVALASLKDAQTNLAESEKALKEKGEEIKATKVAFDEFKNNTIAACTAVREAVANPAVSDGEVVKIADEVASKLVMSPAEAKRAKLESVIAAAQADLSTLT